MEKKCNTYSSEEISRFVDTELPRDLQEEVAQHLVHCRDCRCLVEQYRAMTQSFIRHTEQENLRTDPEKLSQRILRLKNSKQSHWGGFLGLFGKNIYLKLASIAAILVISLIPFKGVLFGPSGPSAIVKSVDTDYTSVMIFETQKEKHTIIWFSET